MNDQKLTEDLLDEPLWPEEPTAEYLGISVRKLQNNRHRGGGIPYVKIGGSVRYVPKIVRTYIIQNIRASTSARRPKNRERAE